jgi:hypothetical protein
MQTQSNYGDVDSIDDDCLCKITCENMKKLIKNIEDFEKEFDETQNVELGVDKAYASVIDAKNKLDQTNKKITGDVDDEANKKIISSTIDSLENGITQLREAEETYFSELKIAKNNMLGENIKKIIFEEIPVVVIPINESVETVDGHDVMGDIKGSITCVNASNKTLKIVYYVGGIRKNTCIKIKQLCKYDDKHQVLHLRGDVQRISI